MLFRGQNILGYRHYADDIVEYFVQKSIANGVDILRIFDALNDVRNLECATRLVRKKKVMYRLQFVTQQVNSIQTKSR